MPKPLLKQRVIQLFGGGCQNCGYSRCHRALHLHHLDPATKKDRTSRGTILRQAEKHPELFKLLCANCHIEEHYALDQDRRPWFPCVGCGQRFKANPHLFATGRARYCSRVCFAATYLTGRPSFNPYAYKVKFVTVTCGSCHREFQVSSYRHKAGRGRYCSRDCQRCDRINRRYQRQGAEIVGTA